MAAVISNPFGRSRRRRDERRRALVRGEAISIDCRLRRTSARGWGPWTDAVLSLGALPDGVVRWHVDDPVAVGLPAIRGAIDAGFVDIDEVWQRPVRFQTEAFWGMEGEIVVLHAERTTTELACEPAFTHPVADRLRDLLGLTTVDDDGPVD